MIASEAHHGRALVKHDLGDMALHGTGASPDRRNESPAHNDGGHNRHSRGRGPGFNDRQHVSRGGLSHALQVGRDKDKSVQNEASSGTATNNSFSTMSTSSSASSSMAVHATAQSGSSSTAPASSSKPAAGGSSNAAAKGFVNANHLLNFQYDSSRTASGGRPSGSGAGGRGSTTSHRRKYLAPKPQKYDRNKFLQANFRFLVSDAVEVDKFVVDADKMLDWEDVVQVEMMTSAPVQCPISLDSPPMCPQITPCGHVYSFVSIMQHLIHHGGEHLRRAAPCPLCYAPIVARELRLVQIRHVSTPKVGDTVSFTLLKRPRGAIIPQSVGGGLPHGDGLHGISPVKGMLMTASGKASSSSSSSSKDGIISGEGMVPATLEDNRFAKFAVTGNAIGLWSEAAKQLASYAAEVLSEGGLEAAIVAPSIYGAMDSLAHRARRWTVHRAEQLEQRGLLAAVVDSSGMQLDPERLGTAAETAVKKLFTAAVSDATAALGAASQEEVMKEEFPSLGPAAAGSSASKAAAQHQPAAPRSAGAAAAEAPAERPLAAAAAGAAGAAGPAAAADGAKPGPASSRPAAGLGASAQPLAQQRQQHAEEFGFEAAFSEEEEEPGQSEGLATNGMPEPDGVGEAPAAADHAAPELLGTSVPSNDGGDLMGTSPNTLKLNNTNTSGEYYMYQASDGQWVFLDPFNLRCLLHHYGLYEACPATISGTIVEMEDVVQSEATRRRWKFFSHLPLTGTFKLATCEATLQNVLPPAALQPFAEELAQRERRRRKRAADERRQAAAEAAAARATAAAKRGPSVQELRAMPLPSASLAAGASSSGIPGANSGDLAISPTDYDLSLAMQASLDAATSPSHGGASGGVSFAHLVRMGFAATGPVLGTSPPLGAAPPVTPGGAWGSKGGAAIAAAAAAASSPAPTTPVASSGWGAGKAVSATKPQQAAAAATNSAASSSTPKPAAPSMVAVAAAAAASSGSGAAAAAAGSPASEVVKKGKKGVLLFSTAQRRY